VILHEVRLYLDNRITRITYYRTFLTAFRSELYGDDLEMNRLVVLAAVAMVTLGCVSISYAASCC